MSDDELAGEDEKEFFEHFAPVYRSLKRTITSRSIQTYAVSVVGILVLSASIGGAVVGVYGTVQEDFGLCSNPIIEVTPPEGTADLAAGDAEPSLPHIGYEELTRDEQHGFRTALNVANNEEEVEGNVTHLPLFRNGALVEYRGEEYYVAVSSFNECVDPGAFDLPFSIAGVVVGAGIVAAPSLWRRFR